MVEDFTYYVVGTRAAVAPAFAEGKSSQPECELRSARANENIFMDSTGTVIHFQSSYIFNHGRLCQFVRVIGLLSINLMKFNGLNGKLCME